MSKEEEIYIIVFWREHVMAEYERECSLSESTKQQKRKGDKKKILKIILKIRRKLENNARKTQPIL
jgi:hypothetical protein